MTKKKHSDIIKKWADGAGSVIAVMWHERLKFNEIEKYDSFIRWLTEEIEYEM